jgi:hypothetical protein
MFSLEKEKKNPPSNGLNVDEIINPFQSGAEHYKITKGVNLINLGPGGRGFKGFHKHGWQRKC